MARRSRGTNLPRLVALVMALLGGVMTIALPFYLAPVEPLPLVLVGAAITAAALECFLFWSI
jgi:hypothetical protein